MKLLLIIAAVFCLADCRAPNQRDVGNLPETRYARPPSGSGYRGMLDKELPRLQFVDQIIAKVKEFAQNIASALNEIQDPLYQTGFTNVSRLIDDIVRALNQFANRVGAARARPRRVEDPPQVRMVCDPKYPQCTYALRSD